MSEKNLGVLGGMGPAASAGILKIHAEKYPAKKIRTILCIYYIGPKIPYRGSASSATGRDLRHI
jgi:aspartate/glutamate racemase